MERLGAVVVTLVSGLLDGRQLDLGEQLACVRAGISIYRSSLCLCAYTTGEIISILLSPVSFVV